jgi:hypothetical protein
MFREYKTFAIFKVSCLILLSSLDSAELAKDRVPSKCCALIDAQITIRFFAYDDSLYTSEQIDLTGVGLD